MRAIIHRFLSLHWRGSCSEGRTHERNWDMDWADNFLGLLPSPQAHFISSSPPFPFNRKFWMRPGTEERHGKLKIEDCVTVGQRLELGRTDRIVQCAESPSTLAILAIHGEGHRRKGGFQEKCRRRFDVLLIGTWTGSDSQRLLPATSIASLLHYVDR